MHTAPPTRARRGRAIAWTVGAVVLAGCAPVKPVEKPHPADALYDLGAFTICSPSRPGPIAFYRGELLTGKVEELRAAHAHESSHEDMARVWGCEGFNAARTDDRMRLMLEALAFCREVRQRVKEGEDYTAALLRAGDQFSTYSDSLPQMRAVAWIQAVCG